MTTTSTPTLDRWQRPLGSLRLSVTDRCNLRCSYCMPEENYTWLKRSELLSFEEMVQLVDVFIGLGVTKVRLTGGEPLLRRDLHRLVALLRERTAIRDLALTTNALLLPEQAADLRAAGLDRLTVSLDSLRRERYAALTARDELSGALAGIRAARAAGFDDIKLNTVVIKDQNDDELVELVEFARSEGLELRFIEYMDVGGATEWTPDLVVSRSEILARLRAHFGELAPAESAPGAPAERIQLPDGTVVGMIASTTAPFCGTCDRSRLTADGHWYRCLYARTGLDLAKLLRGGQSDDQISATLAATWERRSDRGAQDRLIAIDRGALVSAAELRLDPRLEMHKRGG